MNGGTVMISVIGDDYYGEWWLTSVNGDARLHTLPPSSIIHHLSAPVGSKVLQLENKLELQWEDGVHHEIAVRKEFENQREDDRRE
ncbi:hypothetical protein Tco_1514633 [Tanacetum coccineum]